MKINLAILLLVFAPVLCASSEVPYLAYEYEPAKWPQATLRLSQAGTLKEVFDAGLRPYRHPGLENNLLQVKHLNLTILPGSAKRLPAIPLEWMNITPFTDGELSLIEAATPKLTLEQAREEMLQWLPLAENRRTKEDLDQFLKAVEADFLDFDDPYRGIADGCGIGWNEPGHQTRGGGAKCGLGFRKTGSPTHPLRIHLGLDWGLNRPQKDLLTLHPGPIPPPPGYEQVSMEAPKNFGPDSAVDILRSQEEDIGETKGARKKWREERELPGDNGDQPASGAPPRESETKSATEAASAPTGSPPVKWWVMGLVFAGAGGLLGLWFRSRKRSAGLWFQG